VTPQTVEPSKGRAYGVCLECRQKFEDELKGRELEKFRKAVEFPVILVNKDLRVLASNESCLSRICAGESHPRGLRWGEFMGCQNAQSPEHCGNTPNCLECVIRKTANQTLKTGKPQKKVAATLVREERGRKERLEMILSTENLGDLVQVTVEDLSIKPEASKRKA
jgi:hypothetical protein